MGQGIALSNQKFVVDSNGSLTASTITTDGSVTAASIISSGSIIGGDITSSGTLTVSGNLFLDSPTLVVDSVNNRVGVGTTSPQVKLDVIGTISATSITTGDITATGGNVVASTFAGDGSRLTGITNDSFASNIEISTTGSLTAGLGLALSNKTFVVDASGSLTASTITSSGSVTASSIISTGGLIAANSNFVVDSTGSMTALSITSTGNIAGGDIISTGTLTVSGNLLIDSPTLVVDSINNRVGVGTTSPQEKLDVIGTISSTSLITGNITATNGNVVAASFAGNGSQLTGITNSSFVTNIEIVTTGSITAGLGLALSNKTFVVDSTGSMTASTVISNGAVTGNSFNNTGNSFSVNSNGVLTSTQLSTTNNNFVVDSEGSLTASVLTVTGSITAKGDIVTNGAITAAGNFVVDGATLFVDSANNRVGIGTTTPGTQLHLIGNDTWLIPSSSTEGFLVKQEGSGPIVAFKTNTNTAFRIENNNDAWFFGGNVGIGTTTPNQKLVVDGAFVATSVTADSIAVTNGTITANSFVGDGSGVTGIVSAGITNNTIATVDIADGAISSAKILDGQVQSADLQSEISINAGSLTAQTITTSGSVTASKFAISGNNFVVDNVGSMTATSITSTGSIVAKGDINSTGSITASGNLRINTNTLYVDSVTSKIGMGTETPLVHLHIVGGTDGQSARLALENTAADEANIAFRTPQGDSFIVAAGAAGEGWVGSSAGDMVLTNRTGGKITITSDANQGQAPINVLNSGVVGIGTTTSSASVLTVQGTPSVSLALDVRGTTSVTEGFVGIGTVTPSTELEVVGTITATSFSGSFSGNGSGLSGITNNSFANNIEIVTTGSITAGLGLALSNRTFVVDSTGSVTTGNLESSGTITASILTVPSGDFVVDNSGSMTAASITLTGTLTTTAIDMAGFDVDSTGSMTATAITSTGSIAASSVDMTGFNVDNAGSLTAISITAGTITVNNGTVTAGFFSGDGSSLTNVAVSNNSVNSDSIIDGSITTADLSSSIDIVTTGTMSVASGNFKVSSSGSITASAIDMIGFDVDSTGSMTALSITTKTITVTSGTITSSFFSGDGSSLTNIGSAAISDDSIMNDDINSSASISGTKINPNFGSQGIVTTGTMSVASGAFLVSSTGSLTVSELNMSNFDVDSTGSMTATSITTSILTVSGGTITSSFFSGDGSSLTNIGSAAISDDSIMNDDINSSASISGTKINPNFGSQGIVTTGTMSVASGAFLVSSTGSLTVSELNMTNFDVDNTGSMTATSITTETITVTSGTVTAAFFSGDGSSLTNVAISNNSVISSSITDNSIASADLSSSIDIVTTGTVSVASGNFKVSSTGSVTAAAIDLNGFNVDGIGSMTASSITSTGTIAATAIDMSGFDVDSAGSITASAITSTGNITAGTGSAFYLGDPSTDNSWRIVIDGPDLSFERRESGTWVFKTKMNP